MAAGPALGRWLGFRRLGDEERTALSGAFEARRFRVGETICRFGGPPLGLCLVESGEVALLRALGGRSEWRRLKPGAMFGSSSIVDGAVGSRLAARALTDVTLWVLPREACLGRAREAMAPLLGLLRERKRLRELEPRALEAMHRSTVLGKLSPRHHLRLIEGGEVVHAAPGEVLARAGEEAGALFLVAAGKFEVLDGGRVLRRLGPGESFGDYALATLGGTGRDDGREGPAGRYASTLAAEDQGAEAIRIDRAVFEALARRSPGFRRELGAVTVEGRPLIDALAPSVAAEVRPILFLADEGIALTPLLRRLAETIRASFREEVEALALRAPFDDAEVARALGDRRGTLLLDGGLARGGVDLASLAARCDRVVVVTRRPSDGDLRAHCPGMPLDRVLFAALAAELSPDDKEHVARMALPPRTIRLGLDRARLEGLAMGATPTPSEQASLDRLARAVTNRLVGVALGGGGAYGYAHVALLRGLLDGGVPIDMVSGSSFGAVVGAWFCAHGRAGLEEIVAPSFAARLRGTIAKAMLGRDGIAHLVDGCLPDVRLERLEVPFFAVATEVATGLHRAISHGPPGPAVQASGSFPGLFGATAIGGVRFVDGGIADNVPDDVLFTEGAQLVIASNVVPPPLPEDEGRAWFDSWLLGVPGRIDDAWRSFFIMAHGMGAAEAAAAGGALVFNNPPNAFSPTGFGRASEIVARAEVDVAPTVVEAVRRWKRLTGAHTRR